MGNKADKDLDNLFQFVPPDQLRRSVTKVFFSFLTNPKTGLPDNFEQISEDIWFLLTFLEQADQKEKGK